MAIPVVVIAALLFDGGDSDPGAQHPSADGGPLPAVSVAAPPSTGNAVASKCAQVISGLPLKLAGQNLRETVSHPASGQVQAWGDPAIVFSCGVARPASLKPGDAHEVHTGGLPNGPFYVISTDGDNQVWTAIDRSVYMSVTIPSAYLPANILPVVSRAIVQVLPPVCTTKAVKDLNKLCTRRP